MQYRFAKFSGLMEDMKLIRQNGFGKILRNCFPFISSNPTSGKNIRGGNSSCQHEWLKVSLVDEHTREREHNWSLREKNIFLKCSWFKPKKIAALHVDIFGMSRRRCQFVLKIFFVHLRNLLLSAMPSNIWCYEKYYMAYSGEMKCSLQRKK